jgi:hypothetical protein
MRTPTLYAIAEELNVKAREHPIGALQEIRGHRPGNDLFRVNSKACQEHWAYHWGGRTELQFNIGLDEDLKFRHGVAFSFKDSREYKSDELMALLRPKVKRYSEFMQKHPRMYGDMDQWIWDDTKQDLVYDGRPGSIPLKLLGNNVFIFLGKGQPVRRLNHEIVLKDFDRLLPLYQYVQSPSKKPSLPGILETHFAFRAGCRPKKRSTVVQQSQEQIERDLRHNELQKLLYQRLARRFGSENVGTENPGANGTSIDLVVRRKRGQYWFYEIKTATSPRACLREALGQLLEYAFWPGAEKEVSRLVVVGESPLDKGGDDYVLCLRKQFSLPINYEQINV